MNLTWHNVYWYLNPKAMILTWHNVFRHLNLKVMRLIMAYANFGLVWANDLILMASQSNGNNEMDVVLGCYGS